MRGSAKALPRTSREKASIVAICARRKSRSMRPGRESRGKPNRRIVPIPGDLSKDADATIFVAQAHKALGRVGHHGQNNAGSRLAACSEHLSEADWEQSLQSNSWHVRCLRYVLPIMVKQGGGRWSI